VPSGAPVDVAAVLESYCHLSGDLFGWKMLRDGKFLVWIVDMSGHGVQAGLASAVLRVLVDNLRERSRVGRLVTELNRTLEGCVREEHYGLHATAFFLAIDREGRASYCSAGHPPVLVRRADGRIEKLEAGEKPIGLFRDTRYEAVSIELAREDIVLMYTDGLVETVGRDGEPFGVGRLREVLSGRFDRPEAVTGAIYREITARQNVDELEDDITFLAMKIGPDADGSTVSK
jgi:sigma-B regulation protein RsbU (phosphoserine phosphatase)